MNKWSVGLTISAGSHTLRLSVRLFQCVASTTPPLQSHTGTDTLSNIRLQHAIYRPHKGLRQVTKVRQMVSVTFSDHLGF